MAVSYTTTYNLTKPEVGASEDQWGDLLNTNFDNLDDLLDGTAPITGIDINSGTLDGVTIGGTTAGAGTFTTLTANTSITGTLATAAQPNVTSLGTLTSLAVSGNATFGDNDKAIFGAGSDLQIYHSSTDSFIDEDGTGRLYLRSLNGAGINLQDATGNMIRTTSSGSVDLYYANATKLATTSTGVDVTGTITSDGLTVGDGHTIGNDGSDNLEIKSSSGENLLLKTGGSVVQLYNSSDVRYFRLDNNGDISFYEDTGTTPKFFWDASAESLGIGTTTLPASSSAALTLSSSSSTTGVQLHGAAGNGGLYIKGGGGEGIFYTYTEALGSESYSERLRIDSSGNVGIGTSSINARADISSTSTSQTSLRVKNSGSNPSQLLIGFDGTSANYFDGNTQIFRNGAGSSEAMRIDSSGNLLVGKTDSSIAVEGHALLANGQAAFANNGGAPLALNRLASDGDITQFYKDTAQVGSIGSYASGSRLYIGSGDTGLSFEPSNNIISPLNTATASKIDNAIDLGESGARFKDLYLSGGVYLGGTGSANKLDDYEEGLFTPVLEASVTNPVYGANAQGRYTKIGNTVHFSAFLDISSSWTTNGSGDIFLAGLPFTIDGTSGGGSAYISTSIWGPTLGSGYSIAGQPVNGSDYLQFRLWGDNRNQLLWTYATAAWGVGDAVYVQGHYYTNS